MSGPATELPQLFPAWEDLHVEIREVLCGAEALYAAHAEPRDVPAFFLAAPYILATERELVQFYKRKLPRYLSLSPAPWAPGDPTAYPELGQLVQHAERISLGHLVNWLQRRGKEREDPLFLQFAAFTELLDPEGTLTGPRALQGLVEQVLVRRKRCVHVGRREKWLSPADAAAVRRFVLFDDGGGQGYLPRFVAQEARVLRWLEEAAQPAGASPSRES